VNRPALLLVTLMLSVSAAPARSDGTMEDARVAYQSKDYARALAIFRPLAEQGDALAQYSLGYMYAKGQGVTEDDAEALKWYRRSAEQGNAFGQANLGHMYDDGEGVAEDDAEAVKWYRAAAEQGFDKAQYILGLMYARGTGVPRSAIEAFKWWSIAAVAGNQKAIAGKAELASTLTAEQIAEGQRLAQDWKPAPYRPAPR
jgi:TPR repeat protein